jgi:hypothetical protein
MNDPKMFAPDYLRLQKDKQLHLVADLIDKQSQQIQELKQIIREAYRQEDPYSMYSILENYLNKE